MRKIKNILAATDFSPWATVAMRAADLAVELYQAKLVAAHVLQNLDETYSVLVENSEDLQQQERREVQHQMDSILDDLNVSLSRARAVVTRGSPVEGLIQLALQEHADLVVAGVIGSAPQSPNGA